MPVCTYVCTCVYVRAYVHMVLEWVCTQRSLTFKATLTSCLMVSSTCWMNAASRLTDLVERIERGDEKVDHKTRSEEHKNNTMAIWCSQTILQGGHTCQGITDLLKLRLTVLLNFNT